jgi:hypothetical protein
MCPCKPSQSPQASISGLELSGPRGSFFHRYVNICQAISTYLSVPTPTLVRVYLPGMQAQR